MLCWTACATVFLMAFQNNAAHCGTFRSDMPVSAHTVDFWVLTGVQAAQQVEGLGRGQSL